MKVNTGIIIIVMLDCSVWFTMNTCTLALGCIFSCSFYRKCRRRLLYVGGTNMCSTIKVTCVNTLVILYAH